MKQNVFSSLTDTGLDGKVVIITGGVGGIGLATAKRFLAEGCRVILVDLPSTNGVEVAEELRKLGFDVTFMPVDITDEAAVKAMAAAVFKLHGQIDVLVNNAGITADGLLVSTDKTTGEVKPMSLERWNRVLDVNLTGAFNCSQAVAGYMVKARSGCLLFASSVAVPVNKGQANYVASKLGNEGLAMSYALELGPNNVRANAVRPGVVDTEMIKTIPEKVLAKFIAKTPLGHVIDPKDIANAYAWLAGAQARSVTGIYLPVTGGLKGLY